MKPLIALSLLLPLLTLLTLLSSGLGQTAVATGSTAVADVTKPAGEPLPAEALRFATMDILIDPKGQPLGAYQFELVSTNPSFIVVGLEAGDHPAFDHGRPPYYDRTAEQQDTDRLIIAEYALPQRQAKDLPTQPVRVARLHVMFTGLGDQQPEPQLRLITAGDANGQPIDAEIRFNFSSPQGQAR